MKFGIIGYGRMGKIVEKVAIERGHIVSVIVDPEEKRSFDELRSSDLKDADVYLDFSVPTAVVENIKRISELGKDMVVGTTGWYEKLGEVEKIVSKNGTTLIHSQNFSIGMNIFFNIVRFTSQLINCFPQYDIAGFEIHHNGKKDMPSGSAKKISEIIIENVDRKDRAVFHTGNRKINPQELHFSSIRCGNFTGEHVVLLDSPSDTIKLTHSAKNRSGFAIGAIVAAENIGKFKGVHTFDEILKSILKGVF